MPIATGTYAEKSIDCGDSTSNDMVNVAPAIAGWAADQAGTAAAPFTLGVMMLAVCLAALVLFRRDLVRTGAVQFGRP